MRKKAFENIVGKGENAGYPLSNTNHHLNYIENVVANVFKLDWSQILLLVKSQTRNCMVTKVWQTLPHSNNIFKSFTFSRIIKTIYFMLSGRISRNIGENIFRSYTGTTSEKNQFSRSCCLG